MARRISILVDIDLAKYSKEAHAVTIEQIANQIGRTAVKAITENGYTIRKASVTTTLHYVRHTLQKVLVKQRALRKVS